MMNSPFPVFQIEGGPYEQGVQYGSQCKDLITASIGVYQSILGRRTNLTWEECREKSLKFVPFIEEYDVDIMRHIRGIADGSEIPLEDVLVLNVRTELAFLASTGKDLDGCTSLAATPDATGGRGMFLGQNWDWKPVTQVLNVILNIRQKSGPRIVTMVEAGIVAKFGFNSSGIGSCANALISDGWRVGVPAQIIFRKILNSETLSEAIGAVVAAKRASSGNYLIGRFDSARRIGEAVNIEAAPDDVNFVYPEDGLVAHTNHYTVLNPRIRDFGPSVFPNSILRRQRALRLLQDERKKVTAETFMRILKDRYDEPNSICWQSDAKLHEEDRIQTNASLVIDLGAMKASIAKGPPCEHQYVPLDFSGFLTGQDTKEAVR